MARLGSCQQQLIRYKLSSLRCLSQWFLFFFSNSHRGLQYTKTLAIKTDFREREETRPHMLRTRPILRQCA